MAFFSMVAQQRMFFRSIGPETFREVKGVKAEPEHVARQTGHDGRDVPESVTGAVEGVEMEDGDEAGEG